MKKLSLLVMICCIYLITYSQDSPAPRAGSADKFFFGVNYIYLDANMELLSLTKHSVWAGEDLGTKDLTGDDIDSINSYMNYKEKLNNFCLNAGMIMLNKPGGKWYIDGRLMIGAAKRVNDLTNTDSDSTDIVITSEHWSPSFGLGINFGYLFTEKWKMNLGMNTIYAFGKVDEIDENIFPVLAVMDEKRENIFNLSYTWLDLTASYSTKTVTIAAGPGLYFLHNRNEYNIERADTQDGSIYNDNIKTITRSEYFINGTVKIGWRISDHILIDAGAGISKDISVRAGLSYFL
ncbi:MAG: hypothetical protein HGA23_07185 [Bacteroidales bacterium]|nr:hypothetical protein [Bacteroidales bacterium]